MRADMIDFGGKTIWHPWLPMQNTLQTKLFKNIGINLSKGPIAMIFVEDQIEVGSTIKHHLGLGFAQVLVFMPDAFDLPEEVQGQVQRISFDMAGSDNYMTAVNAMIAAAPGQWMYY